MAAANDLKAPPLLGTNPTPGGPLEDEFKMDEVDNRPPSPTGSTWTAIDDPFFNERNFHQTQENPQPTQQDVPLPGNFFPPWFDPRQFLSTGSPVPPEVIEDTDLRFI